MDASSSHMVLPVAFLVLLGVFGIYNLYRRHTGPLSHLPGPAITKYTDIVYRYHSLRGDRVFWLKEVHDQYGPIVRVSPGQASVADLESHKEVHKVGGGYIKSDFYNKFVITPVITIFNAIQPADHGRWRRLLGNSMSESVLKTFEGIVQSKISLLMSGAAKERAQKGFVDVYKWMHFFATDVIGELSFGDSFRMLELGKQNEYIERIQMTNTISSIAVGITGASVRNFPKIWPITIATSNNARVTEYADQSIDRYERYRALNPNEPKPMFFDKIMGGKGQAAELTRDEIVNQALGFLIAGTDTTAVTGTYLIWSMCKNPAVKAKFLDAVKDLPAKPTNEDLRKISYLEHLVDETLRLYGAAPAPLPRVVPAGGRTLAGHFVPAGATVSPVAYVLHRDQSIFPNPDMWIPERWESATKEMRDAIYAFGGGSRVCIGLHLAKMELRGAVTAFFRQFPEATLAYGEEGFGDADMEQVEFFLMKAKGKRCLIK